MFRTTLNIPDTLLRFSIPMHPAILIGTRAAFDAGFKTPSATIESDE